MSSNSCKLDNHVGEISIGRETIGLRESAQDLVAAQKRSDLLLEHRIELVRGSEGPNLRLQIHGISAIEFLKKVEEVIPDIRSRDALVALALNLDEKHRILGEKIEQGRIETPIGRSESEWAKICDSELRAGIGGRSIPLRDLMIASGARHLVEPERAPETIRREIFTRADRWITELKQEEK